MGDLSAKVGRKEEHLFITGGRSLHSESNKNGKKFDYVLAKDKHCASIRDTGSYREADANSDHVLVVVKVKTKVANKKKNKKKTTIQSRPASKRRCCTWSEHRTKQKIGNGDQ
ncbi:hypothetical protein ILUMI_24878 [Ignelater luminosus]|uniref:Uncharacterized protein n=1 Tax=Ignelater luminosus TaxID=2038154 RepID=A0A8K0FWF3_IGNLU|nr:hypothetical protein ILUMI_24878 [Ignelater luminosus]